MAVASNSMKTLNYAFLMGGVAGLIFGIVLLIRQDEALGLLMVILGLWWLIHGIFLVFAVFIDSQDVGWKLAIGLLGVAAGLLVLTNPGEATDLFKGAIGVFLGILGILVGASSLVGATRGGGFGAALFGIISVLVGAMVLANASFTTTALVTIFAALLILDGFAGIYLAIRYK